MPFSFGYSERFEEVAKRLRKKDPQLALVLDKKIRQIIGLDEAGIEHFKNLRVPLQDYKRIHVGNFVLLPRVFRKEKYILFVKFVHHDDAYDEFMK